MTNNLWQDIVTTAVVGTERKPLQLTPSADPLGKLLSQLDSSDPESTLLSAAAAISLYQRAGQLPVKDHQPLPQPCEPDDLPSCSLRAAQQLSLMLQGQHSEFLPEWLARAAKARKRVPEEYLPELLNKGQNTRQLRDAILPVLGKRGRWLAAQNSDWNYVGDENTEETWATGSTAARQLLLKRLRAEDPAQARERVAATWDKESVEERAAFIATFETGLSMADEPFLEAALDDRRKEVRQTAANLLAQLSESRFCLRMIERVRPLIKLTLKPSKYHLEVTLPESCTQAMQRDGVESKPPYRQGERAWWFQQMLSAVPPAVWCPTWGIQTSSLPLVLEAALATEWDSVLLEGWTMATYLHRDAVWGEALLATWPRQIANTQLSRLLEALSAERREAFILNILQGNPPPLNPRNPAWQFLRQYKQPLSTHVTRALLNRIRSHIESSNNTYDWEFRSALKDLVYYLEPSLVKEATVRLTQVVKDKYWWDETVDIFLAILQFREQMLQEF